MDSLIQAARTLRRTPAPPALAALTLGVAVGAATTVFLLANALFLRPIPHVDTERVVQLRAFDRDGAVALSLRDIEDAAGAAAPLRVAGFADQLIALRGEGDAMSTLALVVTPDYFEVLGIEPAIGRFFLPSEAVPGSAVVVIGFDFWQRSFGGDPSVIGSTVRLNAGPATVIGVAPAGFNGIFSGFVFDVWVPTGMFAVVAPGGDAADPRLRTMEAIARLPDGMSPAAAEAVLRNLAVHMEEGRPGETTDLRMETHHISGFDDDIRAGAIGLTAILLVIAASILAIACANVGCVLLARGIARRRELAIRMALGADRRGLTRMLLVENGLIALAGGSIGLLLAIWCADLWSLFLPELPVRFVLDLSLDAKAFAFAAMITALAAVASGLAPSLRTVARRADLLRLAQSEGAATSLLWRAFVVVQITASITLLTVAGMFVRTLADARGGQLGFETTGVLVRPFLDVRPGGSIAEVEQGRDELLLEIEAHPGVTRAAFSRSIPLSLGASSMTVRTEDEGPVAGNGGREVRYTAVSSGYFETIGTPILRGRPFADTDDRAALDVAIVSEAFARVFWPGRDPIGQRLVSGDRILQVIGIAGNVRLARGESSPQPYLYLPFAQWPGRRADLLVRERAAGAAVEAVRTAIRGVAPDVPAVDPVPLRRHIAVSLLPQRIAAAASGVLGTLGALLAALGIFGLVSFTVVSRTREIGVRMAIGAPPSSIAGAVLGQTLRLALIGATIGFALAVVAARVLASLLHGIAYADVTSLATVAALAIILTVGGAAVPVWRALRISPLCAMRLD